MSYIVEEFPVRDWFTVTGRGLAATIDMPEGEWDPRALSGRRVMLDGKVYSVRGVEMHMIPVSPERPYKGPIGLLVKEEVDQTTGVISRG